MKRADRKLALRAQRLSARRTHSHEAIAKKLRISPDAVLDVINRGHLMVSAESHRLTDGELAVMTVLARLEARKVALGDFFPTTPMVDRAAGKRPGWCRSVIDKRLRAHRQDGSEPPDDPRTSLGFVYVHRDRHIELTPRGWAFVWDTGLVLKNWKVPG